MESDTTIPIPVKKINSIGINKIFIGTIFIFMSPRFIGIDILPDFMGYLIILSGLDRLTEYNPLFKKARIFAIISCLFSFGDIYSVDYNIYAVPKWLYYYIPTFGFALLVFNIALYYCIIYGIINMAESANNYNIIYRGSRIFKMLMIFNLVNYAGSVSFLFAGVIESLSNKLLIGFLIFSLIIKIKYLIFLRKSYNDLDNSEIINGEDNTYKYKSKNIIVAFITCLVLVTAGSISYYYYIEKTYLFTQFAIPTALANKLRISLSSLKNPIRIGCRIAENKEGEFDIFDFRIQDESGINETAKQLIEKLNAILEKEPPYNEEYYCFDVNGLMVRDYEQEKETGSSTFYHTYIYTANAAIYFDINDRKNILSVNDIQYIIMDEDITDLINYINNTFTVID